MIPDDITIIYYRIGYIVIVSSYIYTGWLSQNTSSIQRKNTPQKPDNIILILNKYHLKFYGITLFSLQYNSFEYMITTIATLFFSRNTIKCVLELQIL